MLLLLIPFEQSILSASASDPLPVTQLGVVLSSATGAGCFVLGPEVSSAGFLLQSLGPGVETEDQYLQMVRSCRCRVAAIYWSFSFNN